MAGFWKAPRALARMLAQRWLTPSEYSLLNFVAQSGADRPEGFVTTNGLLATVLGVNEKTVRRGLRSLREKDLVDFDDHERIAAFTIRTADALRTLEGVSMSAPMSAGSADIHAQTEPRKPASQKGRQAVVAADISRARAETETETENHLTTFGGAAAASRELALRSDQPAQALVAYYVDLQRELGVEPPKRLRGQTAGQVGELLREGQPAQVVARALELLVERRLHPSTLPSLIPEAIAGPGKRAEREHPVDALGETFEGPDG
jgi:hypothetical protein